ncbi:MAG TPA: ABC transporter permease, partial [Terriglobia bacterium]|nr:ABC transporter permease [Terriglobia bacterium]
LTFMEKPQDPLKPSAKPPYPKKPSGPSLFSLLKPYRHWVAGMVVLTILGNSLNLLVPKIMARTIDQYNQPGFDITQIVLWFLAVSIGIFVLLYFQNIVQTYAAERIARDLRTRLVAKISDQNHAYIQQVTPAKLLTNLTSDVDAIKMFVSQAIASIISSLFLIIGAGILLLLIDWKLGLAVLVVLPVIGGTFAYVLGKVRKLFVKGQGAIDWLNKVINESILGSTLIRLLNSQQYEYEKFLAANTEAKAISMSILRLFAALIPVIVFSSNVATLTILVAGGRFVINGSMTLGDFLQFNSYLAILIFPVIVIGFMSNVMAAATASYGRISGILQAPDRKDTGERTTLL